MSAKGRSSWGLEIERSRRVLLLAPRLGMARTVQLLDHFLGERLTARARAHCRAECLYQNPAEVAAGVIARLAFEALVAGRTRLDGIWLERLLRQVVQQHVRHGRAAAPRLGGSLAERENVRWLVTFNRLPFLHRRIVWLASCAGYGSDVIARSTQQPRERVEEVLAGFLDLLAGGEAAHARA